MNKDELPVNTKELNDWLRAHYQVFEGANRAFIELPFSVSIGDRDEAVNSTYLHRVIFMTLGFRGNQEECCSCIAAHLYLAVTRESWLDASEPLFIRREFSYQENSDFGKLETFCTGRIAFWRNDINKKLLKTVCAKAEGGLANKAVMPEGWFDRI